MSRGVVRVDVDRAAVRGLVESAVVDLVDRGLAGGVELAARLAPYRSGDLSRSIEVVEPAHLDAAGDVVGTYGSNDPDVDYALHVEYGTERGPEQPYLRPSVDGVRQAIR